MRIAVSLPLLLIIPVGLAPAAPPSLETITVQAAVEVQRALPGSKIATSGALAVISRDTILAPDIYLEAGHMLSHSPHRVNVPKANGVMFVIHFFPGQPGVSGRHKGPQFNPRFADHQFFYAKTSTYQRFLGSDATMVVDVLFGADSDQAQLRRAYNALEGFVARNLKS